MKNPPRPLGTPPKEGKLYGFPSFGGMPEMRGGHYVIKDKFPFEFECPSPDSSENPFVPVFGTKDCNG
jgi:hypothetical protein